jgi:hypothetical protein
MTTIRKWRFPILIGMGLIAASGLVYFSNGHIGAGKTQGAIGKRDVYRDGQVASADVATPGSAPVATQAILESSEFKALAKDPQFQQLMNDDAYRKLAADAAFAAILGNADLRGVVQRTEFAAMLHSEVFQHALAAHENLAAALGTDARFGALARSESMERLFANREFRAIADNHLFGALVGRSYFVQALNEKSFALLAARPDGLAALRYASAADLRAASREQ